MVVLEGQQIAIDTGRRYGMHKDSKWAKQIIALQESDGKWGWFHTLSQFYPSPITTEQAIQRLKRLGYTMEDVCIQKAVAYMSDCLAGKNRIPDRPEKLHDWNIFTSLILATRIREFTQDDPLANEVAKKWANIITAAFSSGISAGFYDHAAYTAAYCDTWGMRPAGGRLTDFVNFYPLSLIKNCLNEVVENAVMEYVLHKSSGVYYVYEDRLADLPLVFESKEASRYLAAVELLSQYRCANHQLEFVVDWLNGKKNECGKWDMGHVVKDNVYFPLSDDWRKPETREADCTERISAVLSVLSGEKQH